MPSVFAYGSNMHLLDLERWVQEHTGERAVVHDARVATLDGWALVWNYFSRSRDGGAANIEPRVGGVVHGLVLDVDEPTLEAIDRKEGHPGRYCRGEQPRTLSLASGERAEAWVYVVTEPWVRSELVPPRRAYMALVVEAARDHGLPPHAIAELEAVAVIDP